MKFLIYIVKGIFIGIANVIPGVSGGTMAVSLGIYDKLISSVSGIFKDIKGSLAFLVPILLGAGLGVIGFSYAIEILLTDYTLPTCLAFVGLILGGLPILYKRFKAGLASTQGGKISAANVIAFIILFAVAVGLPMLKGSEEALTTFDTDVITLIQLFFVGIIASATMVIPGVSGSLVMMVLGFYYGIINSINEFLSALKAFDMAGLFHYGMVLVPFGLGVLLGIFLIAKLIEYLFEKHSTTTYSAIIGLIVASPFAIFYNTGALSDLALPSAFIRVIIGVVLMIAGAVVTLKLGDKE